MEESYLEKRIIIGAVVALVAVGVIAAVLILPATPRYKTYSKFGFSFEYPKNMTLSENGAFEWGSVMVTSSNDELQTLSVIWVTMMAPENIPEYLENRLEVFLEKLGPGWENFVRGKIVKTTKAGHQMAYQNYTATMHDTGFSGIVGNWFCDTNDRYYQLWLLSSEENILPIYQRYLDSFICH